MQSIKRALTVKVTPSQSKLTPMQNELKLRDN